MKANKQPRFDDKDRARIYEYIERNGTVEPEALYSSDVVQVEPERLRQLVAILKRDGWLEEEDGLLRVSVDAGTEEEYATPDFAFTIRPARQEDLPGLLGIIRQVAAEQTYIEAESVAEQLVRDDALIRHNTVEARMFFVATVNDEVIGWCHLESPELEKLRHTAELTLGLLEEYRGEGIGSHLLQRGLQWAASNGYEKVYQSLPATNESAMEFLRAHDLEEEARRSDHYKIGEDYVDEVMMARHLE